MSLILEALRKSEAERRRGAAPSLYAEMPPAPATASRFGSRWPLWVGLAALLPVAAWITYGGVRSAPVAATVNQPVAASSAALAPVRHFEARMIPPAAQPPLPPSTDKALVAKTDSRAAPQPVPSDDEPQSAADLAASIASRAQADARRDHDAVADAAVAPVAPSASTSPGRPLSLSDLSTDERKALPPLKMSMHLWNADASQRLVIIDGDRLHEGDRVGNAVVTGILSDGVLLDWNGRQLKLPIR